MKVCIRKYKGRNCIDIDGKIIDSLAFKSFRPTKNNVGDFYDAGIRIFHPYCSGLPSGLQIPYSTYGETWFGDKDYRFENFDKQMDFFIDTAPDSYFFVNLHIDTRQWWLDENPDKLDSFKNISRMSADEKWLSDTSDYVKAIIKHAEEKYNHKILGYFLNAGYTNEWLESGLSQQEVPSATKIEAYKKYTNNESAHIPDEKEMERPENQLFVDPVKDRNLIDFQAFHSDTIAEAILRITSEAQKVLNHNKLVGVFYGYIFEMAWVQETGTLGQDKVYRSPDIDLIATPSSYQFRKYNDACAHMILAGTAEINNILYFTSFDHSTFILPTLYGHPRRICEDKDDERGLPNLLNYRCRKDDVFKTREQTIHAMQREFMNRCAKRTGLWWFDMLEGFYYDDGLMKGIEDIVSGSEQLLRKDMDSNSEIAVFASSESLFYINKHSRINEEILRNQRDALARIGAPIDTFSLNDIDRIDSSKYKLFIFLNAYYITQKQRDYINNTIKKNGKSVLFIGSADYTNDDCISKERMEKMAGMKLSLVEAEETKIGAMNTLYGYEKPRLPVWAVSDDDAEVLGRYNISRQCGLAKKQHADYTAYFSGLGNISATVLREIARQSGVHIYAENNVAVYVNESIFGVYNTLDEFTEITLPEEGEYTEYFSKKKYKTKDKKILLPTGENPAQMLVK